jgi:hypothetical protein
MTEFKSQDVTVILITNNFLGPATAIVDHALSPLQESLHFRVLPGKLVRLCALLWFQSRHALILLPIDDCILD